MPLRSLLKTTLLMRPVAVGEDAPELSLTADEGTWIKLPDFREHLHVVLLFFKSTADDATDAFLKAYDARLDAFEELDTVVFGISTYRTDRLRDFRAELGLEFFLLYDPFAVESRKFGCSGRVRPYSRPAVVIVDKQGQVAFAEHGLVDVQTALGVVAGIEGKDVPEQSAAEAAGFTGVRDPGSESWRVVEIDSDKALSMLADDDSFKLVDVRTRSEFEADHAPMATHLPVDELPHRYQELGQTTHLIFVDQSGGAAAQAAEFMASIGASEVYVVGEGMSGWSGERESLTSA